MSALRTISLLTIFVTLAGCATTSSGPSSPSDPTSSPSSLPSPSGGGSGSAGSAGSKGSTGTSGGGDMSTATGGGEDASAGEASTADERRGKLDRRLDDSLGEFDKTLGEEQRRSAAERDARAAANAELAREPLATDEESSVL